MSPIASPEPDPSGELKPPKQWVLNALMTRVSGALVETEARPTTPSDGLYRVWAMSQLTPDEPIRNDEVQWIIPVLEALTAVGHTESRANACFGLRGLATWGASDAAAALRRVIVREENEDIVQLVAGWFGRTAGLDWSSLAAEDCARVLLLLPLTEVALREELLARLPLTLRVVALPGIVARVTQRALDRLKSDALIDEAQARFEELCRKRDSSRDIVSGTAGEVLYLFSAAKYGVDTGGRAMDWEVYFRGLEVFVGIDRPLAHYDHLPLPERVDTYLRLVSEFARIELERGSNMTWRMMYERVILKPLAKLSVHDLYRDRAMTTYDAVLDAMEAPVWKDLEARRREGVQTRREMEQAARLF